MKTNDTSVRLTFIIKNSYNACQQDMARAAACAHYGIKEISRSEAIRAGFLTGGELNNAVQSLVPVQVPTRDMFAAEFIRQMKNAGVEIEGGAEEFIAAAWKMADARN